MKIIHTADIHLGASPDLGLSLEQEAGGGYLGIHGNGSLQRVRPEKPADLLLVSPGTCFTASRWCGS